LSFANAFRRTRAPPNIQPPVSRLKTTLIGQAIQATVAQLQQQTLLNFNQSLNTPQVFDGSIKFRCDFDIREENIDSRGYVTYNYVSRYNFNLKKTKS
jgi:hypothetical protein